MIKRLWEIYMPHYGKRYWYMNIIKFPKGLWRFIKSIGHVFKYGYPPYAVWNIDYYFVETMKGILTEYLEKNDGYPDWLVNSFEEWQDIIRKMIDDLDKMDPENFYYQSEKQRYRTESSKSRFFELFSKYFYELWW